MKKKTMALVLCLLLLIVAVIGSTVAYLTATDKETNVFTVGGVKIDLIEQQRVRDENGMPTEELEPFSNDRVLMPMQSMQKIPADKHGLPICDTYGDKIINVKNTGKSDCYVRVFYAFPAALDSYSGEAASKNTLRGNFLGRSQNGPHKDKDGNEYIVTGEWTPEVAVGKNIEINGVKYNVSYKTYTTALKPNEMTRTSALIGFYLDSHVDIVEVDGKIRLKSTGGIIDYDLGKDGIIEIPIFAQGVQAAGFAADGEKTAAEVAFEASGLPTNPWATPEP